MIADVLAKSPRLVRISALCAVCLALSACLTSCSGDSNAAVEPSGASTPSGPTGASGASGGPPILPSGESISRLSGAVVFSTSGVSGQPPAFQVVDSNRSSRDPRPGALPKGAEDLVVGECYDPAPEPEQRTIIVLVVPCTGPHKYEIYANAFSDLGKYEEYPGENTMRNFAEERCYELFRPFVGQKWNASQLDIETWYPTPGSWYRERDRQISCALFDRKSKDLIGSARNSLY